MPTTRKSRRRKPAPTSKAIRRRGLTGASGDEELKKSKASIYRGLFYLGTGISVMATALILGKKIKNAVQDRAQDKAENDATRTGDPGLYAKQLKLAFNPSGFDWLQSTDFTSDDLVFSTLEEIPSRKVYQNVVAAYARLYPGRNLNRDLLDELDAGEFVKAAKIIHSKP